MVSSTTRLFFVELNNLSTEMCLLFYADGKKSSHQIDYIILDGASQMDISVQAFNFDSNEEIKGTPVTIGSNSYRLQVDNFTNPKIKACFGMKMLSKKEIRIKFPNINKSVYTNKKDINRSANLMKSFEEEAQKFNTRVIEQARMIEKRMKDIENSSSYLYYFLGIKIYLLVFAAVAQVVLIVKNVLSNSKVDFV